MWNSPFLLGLLVFTAMLPQHASSAEEPAYYSISIGGNLVGYAAVHSQQARRDDQDVELLKCTTSLRYSLLGKDRLTVLDSTTVLQPGSAIPVSFTLRGKTNDTVSHVESEFTEGKARTWSYLEGDDRGQPRETELPESWVLLAGNNFAHWQLLVRGLAAAERDAATISIPVYLPETGTLTKFRFARGKNRDIEVLGASRPCTLWDLEGENLQVFVDAQSGRFVRMDIPAQQTTIAMATADVVELAGKAAAEELLARHFVPSETTFDDYLKVTFLKAVVDVNVIGSGVDNDVDVLTTGMQSFEGQKQADHVTGTVTIQSRPFPTREAPAFPLNEPDAPELSQWLQPSMFIESDHENIVAKSEELTRGATDRWDATLRVAQWVHEQIRYSIADTPSARLALEKQVGDCGPHSTLTVALLRAARIPSRLVGGLLYTPALGGTFGQHAWVEVHMGQRGWLPLDPTTGEYQQINATHIKLFEGLGGVVPKSVTVVAFQPPNRPLAAAQPAEARPLPWKLDTAYTFQYLQNDQKLGTEVFRMAKVKHANKDALQMKSTLNLNAGGVAVSGTTELVVAPNARPLSFHRVLESRGTKATIECDFRDAAVNVKISGSVNLTREIKIPEGTFCFDNNLMGSFAVICTQLDFEVGKTVDVPTFHPSSLQLIPLKFAVLQRSKVKLGGQEVDCFECDIAPIKNRFWITPDGRFVKAAQGNLVIELVGE